MEEAGPRSGSTSSPRLRATPIHPTKTHIDAARHCERSRVEATPDSRRAQQIARLPPGARIDASKREHAAAQHGRELAGVDLVALGLAAVRGCGASAERHERDGPGQTSGPPIDSVLDATAMPPQ